MKVLFVCTGNLCRSLMAERLLDAAAKKRRLAGWEARSCGVAAHAESTAPKEVMVSLAALGVPKFEHSPQRVSAELLEWADLVVAMTEDHRAFMEDRFPKHARKFSLFDPDGDVDDPMGGRQTAYDHCARLISAGIDTMLRRAAEKA